MKVISNIISPYCLKKVPFYLRLHTNCIKRWWYIQRWTRKIYVSYDERRSFITEAFFRGKKLANVHLTNLPKDTFIFSDHMDSHFALCRSGLSAGIERMIVWLL